MSGYDWSKMKDAEVYGGGGNFLPYANEKYKVLIKKTFTKETRRSGDAFIVEFDILASTCDEVEPGETRSWFQSLTKKDSAFSNIKAFLLGCFRVNTADKQQKAEFDEQTPGIMEEIGSEHWETADEEDHPMNKHPVIIETQKHTTSDDNPFTKHIWHPWDPSQEELDELLAQQKQI